MLRISVVKKTNVMPSWRFTLQWLLLNVLHMFFPIIYILVDNFYNINGQKYQEREIARKARKYLNVLRYNM